ncbi:hypothetical protein D3C85_1820770 [compost metagenome]
MNLVDHQGLHAVAAEQGGQRGADRAVADDQYVYRDWQRFLVVMHLGALSSFTGGDSFCKITHF